MIKKTIDWTCQTCKTVNTGARHFDIVRCQGCGALTLVTRTTREWVVQR